MTAAPVVVNGCNGTDNVGGQAVKCNVTVVNNLDLATGETSSITTIEECHGFANAALTCTTTIVPSDELVTTVDQCNGSGNGGGGTVTCSVAIVNNIIGTATPTEPASHRLGDEAHDRRRLTADDARGLPGVVLRAADQRPEAQLRRPPGPPSGPLSPGIGPGSRTTGAGSPWVDHRQRGAASAPTVGWRGRRECRR